MDGFGNTSQDFLTEYRAISGKLKKRFLRRPNVSEASEQFTRLAKKLRTTEEPQYEGLCYLAIARCEQSIGNINGEAEALISASRSFLKAEKKTSDVSCPTFEEHLAASIHSYNHAIRLLSENGDSIRASGLCIELADALIKLEKPGEAITFYQRAADFRPSSSLSYLHARENVARTFIRTGDHHNALTIFTEIANIVEQIGGKPYTSVYLDILGRCELFRVLLLLLIQPAPQNVSPNLTNILEKYAWESSGQVVRESGARSDQHSQESSAGTLGNQYLSEEVFLLLQSIVMAVQVRDGNALSELEDYFVPHLVSEPLQRDLLRELVISMNNKTNGGS